MMVTLVIPASVTNATGRSFFIAYERAKEKGEPALGHEEVDKLPVEDEDAFLTSQDLVKNGEVVTRRYYDENGKAVLDIDYTDHGNPGAHPKVPHRHDWYWPPSGPPPRGKWC